MPGLIADMVEEKLDVLSRMTVEHMAMPFPPSFRGMEIEDQDMVMLDADAYGYTTSVLKGPLTEQYCAALSACCRTDSQVAHGLPQGRM